jgi:hypothetical protein
MPDRFEIVGKGQKFAKNKSLQRTKVYKGQKFAKDKDNI